jgi:hypothetical protein
MTRDAQDADRPSGSTPKYSLEELIPSGRLLYYPCSGSDTRFPLEQFAGNIDSFWFADLRYEKDFRRPITEFDVPCPSGYRVETRTKLKVHSGIRDPFIAIRCQLRNPQSGRRLDVLYLATDAVGVFQGFEKSNKKISVFCHRHDGTGEGGSNLGWLHPNPAPEGAPAFLERVLALVEEHGSIVTDGSNALPEFARVQQKEPSNSASTREIAISQFRLRYRGQIDPDCTKTTEWEVLSAKSLG